MEYVYKYQAINDYTKDALKNRYLYFSKPSQLNDPFDSKLNLVWDSKSIEETTRWLEEMDTIYRTSEMIATIHDNGRASPVSEEEIIEQLDQLNILSLSTIPDITGPKPNSDNIPGEYPTI